VTVSIDHMYTSVHARALPLFTSPSQRHEISRDYDTIRDKTLSE